MSKANEEKLRRYEHKILKQIYGPLHDARADQYCIRKNAELAELYNDGNIVQES